MSAQFKTDPFPPIEAVDRLWNAAWGHAPSSDMAAVLDRSLGHVCAFEGERLIGFVNIATDGGVHAFILDTCVDPEFRRQGIASALVQRAIALARERGAHWLHVDFEPHLDGFYRACGFRPTRAGLIDLRGAN